MVGIFKISYSSTITRRKSSHQIFYFFFTKNTVLESLNRSDRGNSTQLSLIGLFRMTSFPRQRPWGAVTHCTGMRAVVPCNLARGTSRLGKRLTSVRGHAAPPVVGAGAERRQHRVAAVRGELAVRLSLRLAAVRSRFQRSPQAHARYRFSLDVLGDDRCRSG